MVIVPPLNKMAIQGFAHFVLGWGKQLTLPDTLSSAITDLVNSINRYTNITAMYDGRVHLNSRGIFKYPFLYITDDGSFELSEEEQWNLGSYLVNGGFIIIDNGLPEYGLNHARESVRKMMNDVFATLSQKISRFSNHPHLTTAGGDYIYRYSFRPLRKDHDLFHCFFDFDNGPPVGYLHNNTKKFQIDGIYLGNRLVAIYVNGHGRTWHDKRNREQLKMSVNMIVYALTRDRGRYRKMKPPKKSGEWVYLDSGPIKAW